MPLALGELAHLPIPLQIVRRGAKRSERLTIGKLPDDPILARAAARDGARDMDAQLAGLGKRALDEIVQRPLKVQFAAGPGRAGDPDCDL